jgi:hypothetical protein
MKRFISLIIFVTISTLHGMEEEPHPMIQALLTAEIKLVEMRRDVTGDFGQVGQQERNIFMPGTQHLYSLQKPIAESWLVTTKKTPFFELCKRPTDDADDSHDIFRDLKSFDAYDFEQVGCNPIETITSFIAASRDLEHVPWWAEKSTIKAWRKKHRKEFLKTLKRSQRKEIKYLESNLEKYAACFLYQLREKKPEILETIKESK